MCILIVFLFIHWVSKYLLSTYCVLLLINLGLKISLEPWAFKLGRNLENQFPCLLGKRKLKFEWVCLEVSLPITGRAAGRTQFSLPPQVTRVMSQDKLILDCPCLFTQVKSIQIAFSGFVSSNEQLRKGLMVAEMQNL